MFFNTPCKGYPKATSGHGTCCLDVAFVDTNVIKVKTTQSKIVLLEFLIPNGMGFSLVLRFHTFHYRIMEGRKEMFYLTTHSTHFIYGYMASDIR